ncbi:phage tail protein I [Sphingomonas sp.]|uniref:phage tail protein I n=1 Tax=Sphingomonas sp. TaxID=28214 RepID=UPI002EDB1934
MPNSSPLLPPASSPLEQALAQASARVSDVPMPLLDLWDASACPIEQLPWLAWALSVDTWDSAWSEQTKRSAVASSIADHRLKGTPIAVERVLERFDALLQLLEWHEEGGSGVPNTFEIILPLVTVGGIAPGGTRATAAFAEKILREVSRVKPLREHFQVVQQLLTGGLIGIQSALRAANYVRQDTALTVDDSQPWEDFLQAETGEPLQAETGAFLEDVA